MPEKGRTAIIIGGAPAGLSTALRLQQKTDISCRVYELRPEPTTLGGAVGIPSNGMRLLHRLGVHDKILSRGSSHSNMTLRSIQGSVLGGQDLVGWAKEQTGFGYIRIKRTDLVEILLQAIKDANIPVHYNKHITSILDSGNGVKATFSDGSSDIADLLLGCDGIHSSVRRLYVDPVQVPEYSGFAGIGSIVPASVLSEAAASSIRGMNATLTSQGMLLAMTCTASDDEICWNLSGEVPLPKSGDSRDGWEVHQKTEVERIKSELHGLLKDASGEWGNTMKEVVENTSAVKFYPVYRLPLGGAWFKGRCLLLGDAAHAMQPHAGQGVSMALEDSFLLSRLLEERNRSLSDTFENLDQIRRPRVDETAKLAANNAQIRKKTGPWGLWFKEQMIWLYSSVYLTLGMDTKWGSGQKHLVYDIDEAEV